MRALRFKEALKFKLSSLLKKFFLEKGSEKLEKYKKNNKLIMEFMSLLSHDDHYIESIK